MFRIEQNIETNPQKNSKTGLFNIGMPFANGVSVKVRITYKEITLIIGIAVAILVAISLWIKNPAEQPSSHAALFPEVSSTVLMKTIVYSVLEFIVE
jgi:hypothetical protein